MAATIGNQFWKLRSKHGRDKLFANADLMWSAACEYFEWCEENPLILEDFISGGPLAGTVINLNKMRPFTMHGLCSYLDCSTAYFKEFKLQDRKDNKDFIAVITRIEETIYNQKFTGAAAGFLNANIISRDLGLSDKQEVAATHSTSPEMLSLIASKINSNAK